MSLEGPAVHESLDEAVTAAARLVIAHGRAIAPRGQPTLEVSPHLFSLSRPRSRLMHLKSRQWSRALAVGELAWHLRGSDSVAALSYYAPRWRDFAEEDGRIAGSCYGRKIFRASHAESSQWDRIRRQLQKDPASRRAVLTFMDPNEDTLGLSDVACFTSLQFLIRDGRLNCVGTMRSNDLMLGLPYDVFFATMLQELLAAEIGLELGTYSHLAASLHVYVDSRAVAEQLAAEVPLSWEEMPPMRDVDALSSFLSVEELLRQGEPAGLTQAGQLPPYWRALVQPLVRLFGKRNRTSS